MKDRTREAVFNLLGTDVEQTQVWDLFAGSGVMGLEAISRGAAAATLIEQHIPTAEAIARQVAAWELQDGVRVVRADVFRWMIDALPAAAADPAGRRWLVFCCPPYAFYRDRLASLQQLLVALRDAAPVGSVLVVEAERPFDFTSLWPGEWTVRDYPPATIGTCWKWEE
jgi:16S rRNA (guanine966-N2)-methyltransferase